MADIAAGERVAVDEQSTAAHRDNHSTTTTSSGDRLLSHVEETLDHVSHQETTASPHAIIVNPVQKSNPVLRHFRNIPWEVREIIPDYILGQTCCALFLSVRYHILHPDYIHGRLQQLGRRYDIRVLLLLVDTTDCHQTLQQAARLALLADCTLMVAWSYEEAARYLETYKVYENKPPELLMERMGSDHSSRVAECLTTVRKVNRTDAATLMSAFGTMEGIIMASREELALCPGLGPHKADRLYKMFQEPFLKTKTAQLLAQ